MRIWGLCTLLGDLQGCIATILGAATQKSTGLPSSSHELPSAHGSHCMWEHSIHPKAATSPVIGIAQGAHPCWVTALHCRDLRSTWHRTRRGGGAGIWNVEHPNPGDLLGGGAGSEISCPNGGLGWHPLILAAGFPSWLRRSAAEPKPYTTAGSCQQPSSML